MSQDIIDKLRKIRAKAEKTTNEAEAETFMSKFQSLLEQHHLTEADITDETPDYSEDERRIKYLNTWRAQLADVVGRFCGASFTFNRKSERGTYVGKPVNTEAAWELYFTLDRACIDVSRSLYPQETKFARRAEKGVAIGLMARLEKIRRQLPESRLPVVQEHANAYAAQEAVLGYAPSQDNHKLEIDSRQAMNGALAAESVEIQKRTEKENGM